MDLVERIFDWAMANPQILGLLMSLFGTQWVKAILIHRIYDHRSEVDRVRAMLRVTAFALGVGTTYLLWEGDPRHGAVWGVLVGFASPMIYKIVLSWRIKAGDEWAVKASAEDKILRRTPPEAETESLGDETVFGAVKKKAPE